MLIRMLQEHATLLDGIGISLCLLIAGYLICKRLKYARMVRETVAVTDFRDQVQQCLETQQTRRALTAVLETVKKELQLLDEASQTPPEADRPLPPGIAPHHARCVPEIGNAYGEPSPKGLPHESETVVSGLVDSGMDIIDISRSIHRPVAEIEFCAWLAQHRNNRRKNGEIGATRQ